MVWRWRYCSKDVLPFTAMVTMECANVGLNTLFKAATLKGMSYHVFIVYAYAIAALVLLPAPFFSYRSRVLPPLSFRILCKIGVLGLIGCSSQIMGYTGIDYSSPTLASAISNLTPAFTFILAIIFSFTNVNSVLWGVWTKMIEAITYETLGPTQSYCIEICLIWLILGFILIIAQPKIGITRMEKLVWKTSSQAKVMGTIISVTGAFVVTLYKGPAIVIALAPSMSLQQPLNSSKTNLVSGGLHSANPSWVLGGIFLTAEYILVPLWYIVQTQIMKEYPAELTVVFFYNLCVSFMAAIVGLVAERNASAWRMRPDIALASVVCSGLFGSCLNNTVHTWALRLKGPVFVAMFKPLSIAIAVAMGVMFLGDTLHLGSLIGATIISIGFYTVMWGKAKEEMAEDCDSVASVDSPSSHKVPLLQSYKNEQV